MVTRKPPLVLLTAYNGAAYLPAQLSSLCAQAVAFTAILRDDGSADDTPALLAAPSFDVPLFPFTLDALAAALEGA